MNDDTQQAAGKAAGPVAGERLAEARRLRQISLPDIARELHLDEPKVQALEENRFDVLGAPVFAKGHLRKYAEIVGVPIDDVLADYYLLTRSTGAPPVVGPTRRKPPRELNLAPWLLAALLAGALAGLAYWWLGRVPAERPAVTQPAVIPPSTRPAATAVAPPAVDTAAPAAAETAGDDDETALAAQPAVTENAAPSAPPPAVAAGQVALEIEFSGDCWTEVTDADGVRLFFDLGRAGRRVRVQGRVPLRVLLGDSNNASLRVDGEAYPIRAADRRGQTARLTINR